MMQVAPSAVLLETRRRYDRRRSVQAVRYRDAAFFSERRSPVSDVMPGCDKRIAVSQPGALTGNFRVSFTMARSTLFSAGMTTAGRAVFYGFFRLPAPSMDLTAR